MNKPTLTENAAKRITELAQNEERPEDAMLRIKVNGGGCSGFQYVYDFPVYEQKDNDTVITNNSATLLIDPTSLEFMKNAIIDYKKTLGAESFEIKNPDTTANCGCGNSFDV